MISFSIPAARRRALLLAALVSAALGGCGDPAAPLAGKGAPEELEFRFYAYPAESRGVKVSHDTVVAWRVNTDSYAANPVDTVRVVPTAEAWRAFWAAADRAGVADWQGNYVAEGVLDGAGWALRMSAGGRLIDASGFNAYPDRDGREREHQMPAEFRDFMNALDALASVAR